MQKHGYGLWKSEDNTQYAFGDWIYDHLVLGSYRIIDCSGEL